MSVLFAHLDELLPIALPQANGCPAFMVTQMMRLAAVEFCERTRCWRHIVTFTAEGPITTPIIPLTSAIWEIERAYADGRELVAVQHTDITRDSVTDGNPDYISQINPWSLVIHPFPETGTVSMSVSLFLKPRSDGLVGLDAVNPLRDEMCVVPEWMMQQHGERLVDGALSRVLMMEGKPWYSPQRAAYHRAMFDKALNRNFAANLRGQQRAPIRMPTSYM